MKGLRILYKYGNDSLSITDLLKKLNVVNFLERGKESAYTSQREKLRKELREHGESFKEIVDRYNVEHPPPSLRKESVDTKYGAQRRRANLPMKDTTGKAIFGPGKFLSPPREPRKVIRGKGRHVSLERVPRKEERTFRKT